MRDLWVFVGAAEGFQKGGPMQRSFPSFHLSRPPVPHLSGRAIAALSRARQWLALVHTDDPVRLVLNRGFAIIMIIVLIGDPLRTRLKAHAKRSTLWLTITRQRSW